MSEKGQKHGEVNEQKRGKVLEAVVQSVKGGRERVKGKAREKEREKDRVTKETEGKTNER